MCEGFTMDFLIKKMIDREMEKVRGKTIFLCSLLSVICGYEADGKDIREMLLFVATNPYITVAMALQWHSDL